MFIALEGDSIRYMGIPVADRSFTYPEVGATAGTLPARYHHTHDSLLLGQGQTLFHQAAHTLETWNMHRKAGLRVSESTPIAAAGVSTNLGLGPLKVPVRVVYTINEPQRRGFAYGTLNGHPECGEELFIVRHNPTTDQVHADIISFSRPGLLIVRLGSPLGRRVQALMTRRYLRALAS